MIDWFIPCQLLHQVKNLFQIIIQNDIVQIKVLEKCASIYKPVVFGGVSWFHWFGFDADVFRKQVRHVEIDNLQARHLVDHNNPFIFRAKSDASASETISFPIYNLVFV